MKDITVQDIINVSGGKLICGNKDLICKKFSKDTRNINIDDMYVGIKGEKFDGNMLYEEALKKGALGCIIQGINIDEDINDIYKDKVIILVNDTINAIGKIAEFKRNLYNIPVIAVTGSVGKTSTKDIIASVLSKKFNVLKTQGNFNNHIGLPFTILELENHEALVVEMGMNHFGEISYLTNIAKPTIAVITNIGTSHIGILGSQENILKAKLEILETLKKDGIVVINNDNIFLNNWNKNSNTKYKTITYGIDEKSDINSYEIDIKENSSRYYININGRKYEVNVPIGGKHFIYNSMCAICVGISLEIDMKDIIDGISEFELTKKRMDIQKIRNSITIVNDSYNASYDSMKAALETVNEMNVKRKIAVLGNMLELGEFSESLHKKVGEEVYKNKIDILITVGNLAKDIANRALEMGMNNQNIYQCEDNFQVVNLLNKILKDDDLVLLKASNSMKFTEILENLNK